MSGNQTDLKELFLGHQKKMALELNNNKKNEDHPGAKGGETELCWLEMLKTYLPARYQADKAFVIDSNGNKSEEIDVVIYDAQYSPFMFKGHSSKYITAESVYAVFEVKQELSKGHLEYTANKAKSVRDLFRTSASIYHAGGVYPPKDPFRILSGILTLNSSWNPAFGDPFKKIMKELTGERKIDMGCSLEDGAFVVNNESQDITYSDPEKSLISFFLNLLNELQKYGTVPAIDINQYLKSLE